MTRLPGRHPVFDPADALTMDVAPSTGRTGDRPLRSEMTGLDTMLPTGNGLATGRLPVPAASSGPTGPLAIGQQFGPRYMIVRLLGMGGMGAVYQAWDAELDVVVALKVILHEKTEDPHEARAVERRFKQELLLARQVTHRNVVRIHDLGEIDGIKYITMSYLEGEDLATVLKRAGKLPVPEALKIMRQVAAGLLAAHDAGVVHRDLKPANIMIEADHAVIMDFGVARSSAGARPASSRSSLPPGVGRSRFAPEATMAGSIVGTVAYMAPEQARGESVDHRADIYTLGLIVSDLLLGPAWRRGNQSAIEELQRRMNQAPPPLRSVDPRIPEALERVVSRSVQPDPAARFQTTADLVADLNRLDENGKLLPLVRRLTPRLVGATAAIVIAMLGGTYFVTRRAVEPPQQRAPLSVLIANFDNRVKDPVLDGTLEQSLGIAIEGASFITAYPRRDALRVAAEMKAGSTLDEPVARLVANREGIQVVLSGSIEPDGGRYAVTVKAQQPDGTIISNATATASSKSDVLRTVASLASRVRRALGDTEPPKPGEMDTFTTVSLEAAHAYALGQENVARPAEAVRYYQQAVAFDPNLGRAYAGLAVANFNLKNQSEAGDYYKKALALVAGMTEREKYRTLGGYYLTVANNYEQAIETLRTLVTLYPADAAGHTNLSTGYKRVGNMVDAAAASRRAVEITPGNLLRRYNYASASLAAGDLTTAATEADRILQKDSGFVYAYLPLGLAALLQGNAGTAAEFYARLAKVSPLGASLGNMGLADLEMYAGRPQAAAAMLRTGIAEDEKAGSGERAYKLVALAEAHNALGRKADARSAAEGAVKANDLDDGIRFLSARALVEAGGEAQAEKLATELEARLQKQARSLALMIRGDLAMKRNRLAEALDAYREAQKQHDSWFSHLLLGKAYVEANLFPEAFAQLDAGAKRAGEATDLFGANTTTLRYLPPLHYWLGRAQEGLGAIDAARKDYQRFVAIRAQANPVDRLLTDARKRVGR